jgi:hypothetical protein
LKANTTFTAESTLGEPWTETRHDAKRNSMLQIFDDGIRLDMPSWAIVTIIVALLATCGITNVAKEDAKSACYEAGFSPAECP